MNVRVLHFKVVGNVASIFIHKLRRHVAGVYLDHWGVSRELDDLLRNLMTVKPDISIIDMIMHPCFKEEWERFPNPYEEMILPKFQGVAWEVMQHVPFKTQDIKFLYIKESLSRSRHSTAYWKDRLSRCLASQPASDSESSYGSIPYP